MAKESFELKAVFNVTPPDLYKAWLDGELHSKMTGGLAECSNEPGGMFTAWDGYISGENKDLIEGSKIVQSWRTTEFEEEDEDSLLTLQFREIENGMTELTLHHSNIPEGRTKYEDGWRDHYFQPMSEFFK